MRFLSVASHLLHSGFLQTFPRGSALAVGSWLSLLMMSPSRYSHRGLAPHKFAPMLGAHPSIERTVNGLRLSPAAHLKREPAAKHIMSRSIVAIYAAAVCFASVGCMAIALGVFAHSTVSLVAPSLTMPPVSAARYEPQPHFAPPSGAEPPRLVPAAPLSEAELLKRRAAAHEVAIQDEVASAGRAMLRWGIVSIVAGILFFAHWRILRKERLT